MNLRVTSEHSQGLPLEQRLLIGRLVSVSSCARLGALETQMASQGSVKSLQSPEAKMVAGEATVADWLQLIRAEYLEIPGLHLTRDQVRRLWGLDDATCDALLEALIEEGFLRRTRMGAYIRG
jgi:hypothetical protein